MQILLATYLTQLMFARYNNEFVLWKSFKKSRVSLLDTALASTERKDLTYILTHYVSYRV